MAMITCKECGKEVSDQAESCPNCGIQIITKVVETTKQSNLQCPKCKSHNIVVQAVTEVKTKRRGCLGWILWILLACITIGLIIIIPLLTNSKTKSKTHSEAVCQDCGYRWKVK